jgi:hypothetical protein
MFASIVERRRRAREEIADTEEGDIEFGVGGAFYDGNETLRRTKHIFTLVIVITIGAVLPAVAIFVATDAKDFLSMEGGLDVVDGKESRLVGRMIQVTYTAVLSLFPPSCTSSSTGTASARSAASGCGPSSAWIDGCRRWPTSTRATGTTCQRRRATRPTPCGFWADGTRRSSLPRC